MEVLRGALGLDWVETLREAVDEALARPSPLGRQLARDGGAFFSDLYLSAHFPRFRDFAMEGPLARLLGELAGLDAVTLFTDELLVKEPHTRLETPWHHDASYWPIAGSQIYSVWLPLDAVHEDSGALQFARGSHRWNRRFHPTDFDTGATRVTSEDEEALPPVSELVDPEDVFTAEVEPGDVVVFNALTLHRAGGNPRGLTRRRAVVLRLVGPDVRFAPRPRTLPLIWAPLISPGDPLDDALFPKLWSRT
ncbi:MAG: phytanoyl-CoA dioxygenase family protein [Alphaproteobacteria bacterium]|nr:phytanoyl-CoA dioxygenase family protein [Alphaproteobacteria bacterium]MCB9796601.1 phytanoyl-CoA dioxygenase family protein [Alphaproteobacteria bacterium]